MTGEIVINMECKAKGEQDLGENTGYSDTVLSTEIETHTVLYTFHLCLHELAITE